MVRQGFTRAYGTNLRRIIRARTQNRPASFIAGIASTALLQSSTATSLIVTSFAKRGFITCIGALAVILGADVGTTLVAQALHFDLSFLPPLLLAAGIIAHMIFEHGGRKKHVARAVIGIGLMLLSLSLIREASLPLRESQTLPLILSPLQQEPLIAIAFAALLTIVFHSSLASVLLFVTLHGNGIIGFDLGLIMVLGANIGGAAVPFLVTYKQGAFARQITGGNMIMKIVFALLIFMTLPWIAEFLTDNLGGDPRKLLHFHTGFNVAMALVFLPLLGPISILCEKLFPHDETIENPSRALYLEESALGSPVVALAGAARETLRMADMVEKMLADTIETFESNDPKLIKFIREMDNTVDEIYKQIKLYMTRLSQESLDPKEADRYQQIMTYATNLEYSGDIIDKNLMELAEKKMRKQEDFSRQGHEEIRNFHNAVLENMRMAQTIFLSEDPNLARQLVDEKKAMRIAQLESSKQHFERLRSGLAETLATSSLHLDIMRDYRRINSYVTTVAYAILDNAEQYEKHRKYNKDEKTKQSSS